VVRNAPAGHVDQRVETSEPVLDGGERLRHRRHVGDVHAVGEMVVAVLARQRLGDLLGGVAIEVENRDRGTLRGEPARHRRADTVRSPGHRRDRSVESCCHDCIMPGPAVPLMWTSMYE
jgi:hypothetical protein